MSIIPAIQTYWNRIHGMHHGGWEVKSIILKVDQWRALANTGGGDLIKLMTRI